MKREIAKFSIQKVEYLDPSGNLAEDAPAVYGAVEGHAQLVEWYKMMVLGRVFDAKASNLQKTGQIGTYPSMEGQEAVGTGVASAMEDDDVLLTTYREHDARIRRDEEQEEAMTNILLCWGGDERGHKRAGRNRKDFPLCITIATHCGHAVGVAMAMKIRKENRVAVCMLGDGATSKGDVHEAMNWASVWRLPLVFVIVNNQYAISQPRKLQSGAETLAQLGVGAGVQFCKQVDGNDVIAMYEVTVEALERARSGQGPTVIEALTYARGVHTPAGGPSRYRPAEEVEEARKNEPLIRLRLFLERVGVWNETNEVALQAECKERVEGAVKAYRNIIENHPQTVDDMFVHMHAKLPATLKEQLEIARAFSLDTTKEEYHGS